MNSVDIKTIGTIITMWGITNSCLTIITAINTNDIMNIVGTHNYKKFLFQYVSSISLCAFTFSCTYSLMKHYKID